jgi:LacI family transcriptional regulator
MLDPSLRTAYCENQTNMSNEHEKVTIREVAAAAGVSRMTVTRVMRQDPLVSPATRQAVQEAIDRLGYEPLQAARNLGRGKPKVIGVIAQRPEDVVVLGLGYEYLTALHMGVLQVCNDADYGMMLFPASSDQTVERLVRRVRAKQVGGYVVAAPATDSPGLLKALRDNGIMFSAINPAAAVAADMTVCSDDRAAVRKMVEQMVTMGHRKIAFAGAGDHQRACRERLAGYMDALASAPGRAMKPIVLETKGIAFADGLALGRELFKSRSRPTAIQCITDDFAAGLIAAAHERRMVLPEEMSIAGFDNIGLAMRLYPALTTATLPVREMAMAATRQVIAVLEGREHTHLGDLECPVVARDSLSPMVDAKAAIHVHA